MVRDLYNIERVGLGAGWLWLITEDVPNLSSANLVDNFFGILMSLSFWNKNHIKEIIYFFSFCKIIQEQ